MNAQRLTAKMDEFTQEMHKLFGSSKIHDDKDRVLMNMALELASAVKELGDENAKMEARISGMRGAAHKVEVVEEEA